MRRKILCQLKIVCLSSALLCLYSYYHLRASETNSSRNRPVLDQDESSPFLVNTPTCKIPNLNPFDPSVAKFLRPGRVIQCRKYPSLTYENGTKLHINWTAVHESKWRRHFGYCRYQPIYRPFNVDNHDYYRYLEPSDDFNTTIEMKHDFVRVHCFNDAEGKIYTNFHQFILPNPKKDELYDHAFFEHKNNDYVDETLNVIMIGVDSISRLNSMRYLKQTRSYLLNELGAIEMNGYNKVADNTFVNIVPMTMGKFLEEVPWDERMNKTPFDSYDFIWKQFSRKGYRTLYAEDAPEIAIFDYLKAGFHKPPADYFNRHFSIAMTRERSVWYNLHNCVTNRLETRVLLDYIEEFTDLYRFQPYFAFSFVTGLTHDVLESTGAADTPYVNFLRSMKYKGNLNNTLLIFYSDHGMRFGQMRETYVGKMEERLPFMFLVFPPWFLQKYPKYAQNLRTNSKRLSTPFDIYETLRDILHFNSSLLNRKGFKDRGISLLREIPEKRTCEKAGILPHWCTCSKFIPLSPSENLVRDISFHMIAVINRQLLEVKDKCEILEIKRIKNAIKLLPSDEVLRFEESKNDVIDRVVTYGERVKTYVNYQLTFETTPGGGVFEATMQYDEQYDSYKMISDISRINQYGDQSICIEKHKLKKFCYCRR